MTVYTESRHTTDYDHREHKEIMLDLKEIRKNKGLSLRELADITGLSHQYLSFIESGERGNKLPVPTAKKIAEVLGFDWTEFYKDSEKEE